MTIWAQGKRRDVNKALLAAALWASSFVRSEAAIVQDEISMSRAALYTNGLWINDVPALMADTTLTYKSGQDGSVTVGEFIRLRKEGFTYQVAPADTRNQHVTTAGGVKLYVVPGPEGWNIKSFGDTALADASCVIQKAIDAAHDAYRAQGRVPQNVYYPDGGTYMCRLLKMKPGVNHIGSQGATLKKTPADGQPETATKWWRVLEISGVDFNAIEDCYHRIRVEGLIFDGNLANMDWTNNSYNQEQAHCLFFDGPSVPTSAEHRVKAHVKGCKFQNNVADGCSIYRNVDIIVEDIEADNCFRGGFVSTGGNSKVILRGYKGENARADIEIDGQGYDGIWTTDFDVSDIEIDRNGGGLRPGGIDIGGSRGGSFRARNVNVHTSPFNFMGEGGGLTRQFEGCLFTIGGSTSTGNRFVDPVDCIFTGCTFVVKPEADITDYRAIHIYPRQVEGATMEWRGCRFVLDPSVKLMHPTATCYTIGLQASKITDKNDNGNVKYIFRDCESVGAWDRDLQLQQGGTVEIHGGSCGLPLLSGPVSV